MLLGATHTGALPDLGPGERLSLVAVCALAAAMPAAVLNAFPRELILLADELDAAIEAGPQHHRLPPPHHAVTDAHSVQVRLRPRSRRQGEGRPHAGQTGQRATHPTPLVPSRSVPLNLLVPHSAWPSAGPPPPRVRGHLPALTRWAPYRPADTAAPRHPGGPPAVPEPARRHRLGEGTAARRPQVLHGFKKFIMRGNVIDLAVAFVMGAAFVAVVNSLVNDLLTPLIAAIFGKQDFSALTFTVNGSVFRYGAFINALISFVLIAAALYFFVVAPLNTVADRRRRKAGLPVLDEPPTELELLTQMRDLLREPPRR
ncbi:large conductance mechanosensitive channel protein MscL [Kitasatospora camelliae]|uniref:Large-conductance mechanosensitive channel n=1 Tax=Kitasatospora camelliae TaxID=3156397 RepID=A0AAU8K8N9_9ACTN